MVMLLLLLLLPMLLLPMLLLLMLLLRMLMLMLMLLLLLLLLLLKVVLPMAAPLPTNERFLHPPTATDSQPTTFDVNTSSFFLLLS